MKRILFIFYFFIMTVLSFAQNFSLVGWYRAVDSYSSTLDILSDTEAKIEINDLNGDCIKTQFVSYKVVHIDGMPFLQFSEQIDELALQDNLFGGNVKGDSKVLFLASRDVDENFRYSYSNRRNYPMTFISYTRGFSLYSGCLFSAAIAHYEGNVRTYADCTSFLTERTKSYPVENLCNLADSTPWVEGVPGDGIGEGFVIKCTDKKVYPTLLIMNGYISYEKPYLYKQNNRIKKIKVTGVKSGKSKTLDVLDTPHPQTVDISFITKAEDLRVEIADVYKGTKYDDTCVHFMITWDTEVIPYENSAE